MAAGPPSGSTNRKVKAPAGSYTATATLIGGSGASHSANFTTNGQGPQKEITITFARPTSTPSQ